MKRFSILLVLLAATVGCSYKPMPVAVYGKSGVPYSAPTLCEALLKCQANEPSCFYNTTTVVDLNGRSETEACREVKK